MRVNLEVVGFAGNIGVDDEGEISMCWENIFQVAIINEARIQTFDENGNPVYDSIVNEDDKEFRPDGNPICHVSEGYSVRITFPLADISSELEEITREEA
ncbi:hypothetical protein HGB13_01135 [bacterium]|nr:hypothetical protein [bacterium]